jgi:peptide/nickel transport system permease protein
MSAYITKRCLLMLPVVFGLTLVIFFAMRLVPGDALVAQMETAYLGQDTMDRIRHEMGLDIPVYEQYLNWLAGVPRGDLGKSLLTGEPVLARLLKAVPVTAELALWTISFAGLIGIPIGLISATMRGSPIDHSTRMLSVAALSIPNFVLATLVISLPAIWWNYSASTHYVPPYENLVEHLKLMLPAAFALGAHISAVSMRMTRSSVLEVLGEDYIRTARAKGLSGSMVVLRHAVRNAFLPVFSILGEQFGYLLAGTVIVETIFGFPGIGQLTLEAIQRRDYTQIQGNILFVSMVFLVTNLVVDLAYGWLDPRIRFA